MENKIYQYYLKSSGISIDSRNIKKGNLFFALKGDNFDGNKYALEAIKLGASLSIVDDPSIDHEQCIIVDNVLNCLQNLSQIHRRVFDIPVIAITGSNGKTTTKELLVSILKTQKKVHATKGNLNNHIGVPLSILGADLSTEILIIEMGANHLGEIRELCLIAEPTHGLITNIGKAHLEGFGSVEGVKKAKFELFQYLSQNDGTCFVNGGDKDIMSFSFFEKKLVYYNLEKKSISESPTVMLDDLIIKSNLIGSYNIPNISAAVAIAKYFGITNSNIKTGVENYSPINNRSQLIEKESNRIILDAYNANPTSMAVSIDGFLKLNVDHNILILGAMKELGDYTREEHMLLVNEVAQDQRCVAVFFVGDEFEGLVPNLENLKWFENKSALIEYLKLNPLKNSNILIKGSRSNKLEELLEFI